MKTRVLIIVSLFFSVQLYAADYYWVGGGGNWSQLSHWRLGSSAGSIPSIVPSTADNVFFGAYSGFGTTTATKTVTLDANGFCRNMTWESGVANSPIFTKSTSTFTLEVWGDVALSGSTTYNVSLNLRGGTTNLFSTNGLVLGSPTFGIDKPGGSITVTDSLVATSATVSIVSGAFNIAGKKMNIFIFSCSGSNLRSVDFTNSDITVGYQYFVTGANKTVNATGSTVAALGYLHTDNIVYNKVINNAKDAGNFSIYNCTFSTLSFINPTLVSDARIQDGNTADTIRFLGSGSIGSGNQVKVITGAGGVSIGNNNTIDSLIVAGGVSIGSSNTIQRVVAGSIGGGAGGMGGSNTVTYWRHNGPFTVSAGPNTVDSLLLTPGKVISFRGAFNVNKYLELNGTTCDAFSEVSGDSVAGSLNFAPGATAVMNNMVLTGVKASGAITPLAVSGIDNGGNAGFTITAPTAASTTLYWVAGPGDWNDRSHWSTSSGGTGGACVPYIGDDVIFDGNSGLSTTGTITTSSSSFCRNMTWTNVGNVTFTESGTYRFYLYGSLIMDPSVTMNALIEMPGNANASITTNGSTSGGIQFIIDKTNAAVVTFTDDWNNPAGGSIVQRRGGLNLSGRTINLAFYSGNINSTRAVDISNATLNFTQYWDYRGTGKSLVSSGSHITAPAMVADGLSYPWVDATGLGGTSITGASFGQLTFTDPSATSNVALGANNTIRRLEFKGRGALTGGGNSIDTLLLAGSRNYTFAGTNTINKYLKAQSSPCAGLSEIKGNPAGTLSFASGAIADISNVYLQNITGTGPITPIAFSGADAGGNTGWTINVAAGSPRYWVGGGGDWNDPAHWSATSGGTPGSACVPTVYDNVYFDAGSGFTAANKTVTINNGNAYAYNVNWTGALNSPVWSKSASWALEVWGDSLTTIPAATFSVSPLLLRGSNAAYLKGGAPAGNFDIEINKTGGAGLTLLNDYNNAQTDFIIRNGPFNAAGLTLNVASVDNLALANASSLNISGSSITAALWRYSGTVTSHSLQAANSVITTPTFIATGLTYNKTNISGTASSSAAVNSTTIDSLIFTNPSTSSAAGIGGAGNTLNYVEYKGSGGIYGTGNTIDTLVFFPGNRYVLNSGTNTTISGEWYGSGTPCRLTEVVSSTTTNATITKTSGDVRFDYVRLQRIAAAGGATYSTQSHSIDLGGNTGWTMAPYNGAAPIYGLGPDTAVAPADFPITLRTDGFFGDPSSQYVWNDNSTADTLRITGPGTYSVQVNFVDGCNISDAITVTAASTLPITLGTFTVRLLNDCSGVQLNWTTSSEQNSKDFTIQRSPDGSSWSNIGIVAAAGNSNQTKQYGYTDASVSGGIYLYRLQLNDIDGRQKMSKVVSVRLDCATSKFFIYPNPVQTTLTIQAPVGGGKKILAVYTATGQPVMQTTIQPGAVKTIPTHDWKQGVYMVIITENNKQVLMQKLMKQ